MSRLFAPSKELEELLTTIHGEDWERCKPNPEGHGTMTKEDEWARMDTKADSTDSRTAPTDLPDATTHTPGPWTWFTRPSSAKSMGHDPHGQAMKFLVGSDGQGFAHTVGLSEPRDTRNANLIAAAPALYSALQLIKSRAGGCTLQPHDPTSDDNTPEYDAVREIATMAQAALALVEGTR